MAKVTGPLQSFSASGSVAKALTFMSHLGRNVVRGYKVPSNPKTVGQGNQRLIFASAGQAVASLVNPSDVYAEVKTLIPSGSTVPSELVKGIIGLFPSATALNTAFGLHTKSTVFQSESEGIGMISAFVDYADPVTNVSSGAQLFALATLLQLIHAGNPSELNFAPFTTPISTWDTADIQDFVTVITTVS